ncbi:hypothetical protein V8B55DRAFT_1436344 [Mucor lusitanicus]|uniref:Uncharacterized protein n=1 Tax=Mucor lusitanicus CBS 277.49 TaxID=747725 RepID=A0A168PXW5_MUCCL|nr:hypothetical protein MUCCIDRAFT_105365 [Mucor lusitanicus CBS 277.49]
MSGSLARHETAYVAAALDIILYTTWPPYQIPFATEYVDPKEPFRLTNDKNELKLIKAPMQET